MQTFAIEKGHVTLLNSMGEFQIQVFKETSKWWVSGIFWTTTNFSKHE